MQIQQATYGSLHNRTKGKLEDDFGNLGHLPEDTQVFLARKSNKIVGTALVRHTQLREDREIQCRVEASSSQAEAALVEAAREATRHLKRRFHVY